MLSAVEKASILVEALPYIKKFYGKTVVIKYGGNAMLNDQLKQAVMQDVILMKYVGMNPVLVHGGGPEINNLLKRVNIESQFVNGLRITDAATMEIVEMVLVGKVNKEIVSLIHQYGGKAVGLSGKDGNLLLAKKKLMPGVNEEGEPVMNDIGFVGDVAEVNTELIQNLSAQGFIPVVAPVGVGEDGQSYNINADYVAGELAAALKADKLVLLTDVEGIFANYQDKATLISSLKVGDVEEMIKRGAIAGGMIPKVQCCVQAIEDGVGTTHIIDGRLAHSILLEVFTDEGIGTMVVP